MFAQTKFKEGHYINLNNEKISGLIKDYDWKNNPTEIEFKLNEVSELIILKKEQIKEFEIYNNSKYINVNVKIDKSSNLNNQVTLERELIFTNENILLKVLVEGQASLYQYQDKDIEKFFYSINDIFYEQLIFKMFLADIEDAVNLNNQDNNISAFNSILVNDGYKKQLFQNVNCDFSRKKINNLTFSKSSLYKYFVEYNTCKNINFKSFKKSFDTQLKIKGVLTSNFNSLKLNYLNNEYYSNDFDNSTNLAFGLEIELVLPFNNNKWSVFVEPSYNTYSNSAILKNPFSGSSPTQEVDVKFNYIQIPFGIKHYFFLNNKLSLDLNLAYNARFSSKDNRINYENGGSFEMFPFLNNYAFGVGVNYNKISIGLRLFTQTQILSGAFSQKYANYNNLALSMKYQIL
jgi:hypothetical protein